MDVLALLTADHNRVRGHFDRFNKAEEASDQSTMADIAAKIARDSKSDAALRTRRMNDAIKS